MVTLSTRRSFLRRTGLIAGGGALLSALSGCGSSKDATQGIARHPAGDDYGPLRPTPDQFGNRVLALPSGFNYVTFSRIGAAMSDGNVTPGALDGMACFDWSPGRVRLIRNHEARTAPFAYLDPSSFSVGGRNETRYDSRGVGGTVTLEFDLGRKTLESDFISLNGTIVNCSGGIAWRNTGWLSCEESVAGPVQGWGAKHGYVFYVPLAAGTAVTAIALPWLGRFEHEAAATDACGFVYETEDAGNSSGFYRGTPIDPANLNAGGRLQMLAIQGMPKASLYRSQIVGKSFDVEWVDIDFPDTDLEAGGQTCFGQGFAKGGAALNRLEGVLPSPDRRSLYFISTSGGDRNFGQIWQLNLADGTRATDSLMMLYESPSSAALDAPDNFCMTPQGGLLFCEDDAVADGDVNELAPQISNVNRLVGMGADRQPFEFAINILNSSEFAGACFSPDGSTLFVNIYGNGAQDSGMTCAIWGPWSNGPL